MTWPTGQEYSDCIQTPRSAFQDPELRSGSVESDRLGLPKPRSGSFAVVYKLACGPRTWAVKCFTRQVSDQQRRYAAISAHLRASANPYMVAFEYLARGILVRGQWFPILKMEWVSGDPLLRYVEARLRDPVAIRLLAARWVEMVRVLRAAGIAHGDLQHGNVLVVGGDLKLVDYDGMFVPALAGLPATEVGHPNYQHPGRGSLPFGPSLDNFSAWCIYVSLIALSTNPSLWNNLAAGDDCLLFRAGDLAAPDHSPAFRALAASSDGGLLPLVELFSDLLRLTADQIPPLDEPRIPIGPPDPSPQSRSASWLDDHVNSAIPTATRPSPVDRSVDPEETEAYWVLDYIVPPASPRNAGFTQSVLLTRILLWVSLFVAILTLAPGASDLLLMLATALPAVDLLLIANSYGREPGVAALKAARASLLAIDGRLREATARMTASQRQIHSRRVQRDQEVAALESRARTAAEEATRQIDEVKRHLDKECAQTQKRRRQIDAEAATALTNIGRTTGARAASLRNQLQTSAQQEATELANALTTLQNLHRRNVLSAVSVAGASIQGLGPKLKQALILNGVTTAYDVDQWKLYRIPGFGPARVTAVRAWASSVEQRARATIPQTLPASRAQALRAKYAEHARTIALELQPVESQQRTEETAINSRFAAMRNDIHSLEVSPRAAAERDIQAIKRRRDNETLLRNKEKERAIAAGIADLAKLQSQLAALRRSRFAVQLRKSRAAAQVQAYAAVSFWRYLRHIAFGTS